jgi:hypothetical protein
MGPIGSDRGAVTPTRGEMRKDTRRVGDKTGGRPRPTASVTPSVLLMSPSYVYAGCGLARCTSNRFRIRAQGA